MRHEDAVLLLPDMPRGKLDRIVAADLTDHLATCQECRGLLEMYDLLSRHLRLEAAATARAHPSSPQIVTHALRAAPVETEELVRTAAHLRHCPDCSKEVDAIQRAEEAHQRRPSSLLARFLRAAIDVRRPGLAATLAAGIVVALLGYPAFLGIYRLPLTAGQAEQLRSEQMRSRSESDSRIVALISSYERKLEEVGRSNVPVGAVEIHLLPGGARGGAIREGPTISADQAGILLAVAPSSQVVARDAERYRFEILSGTTMAWSWEMTGGEIRRFLRSAQGAVILSVPAASLPPGRYQVRLVRAGSPAEAALFVDRFEIVP